MTVTLSGNITARRHGLADREPASGQPVRSRRGRWCCTGPAAAPTWGSSNIARGSSAIKAPAGWERLGRDRGFPGATLQSRGVSPPVKRWPSRVREPRGPRGRRERPGGTSINTLSTAITLLGDTTISTDAGQLIVSGAIGGAAASRRSVAACSRSRPPTPTRAQRTSTRDPRGGQHHRPGRPRLGRVRGDRQHERHAPVDRGRDL